jgi:hypothetical protein
LPKKGSHFEKKNEKIIKIYVLDIPKYSFIILYKDMFPGKNKVRGLERHPDIYPFCQFHEKCPHFSLFLIRH